MPGSVSSLSDVQAASRQGSINLVALTAASLPTTVERGDSGFPSSFASSAETAYEKLGPGDRLQVRVWEGGTPSVFTAGPDLGELTVDETGRLYLPYVGAIQAAGQTIPQVRATVIRRLSSVVLRPQVDIREVERRSMLVTVQGDAAKTGVYPITRGRTRLSALLAEVAPSQKLPEMLRVTVRRGDEVGQVRLSDVYRDPRLDIALHPGDSIILNEVVENVTVLGAAGIQGQFRIPQRDFSLMDAIGQARGLSDDAADPRAVFLLRPPATKEATPTVYQLDMRRPDTIALATRFTVQDGDAVLISNAPFTQTRKMLQAFSATLNPVRAATTMVP